MHCMASVTSECVVASCRAIPPCVHTHAHTHMPMCLGLVAGCGWVIALRGRLAPITRGQHNQ